jgi:hypothetical protein
VTGFWWAVAALIVGAVIGIIVHEVKRAIDNADAGDALRIGSASYRHSGDATNVTVVVKNRSGKSMTVTGAIHIEVSPDEESQPSEFLLLSDEAAKIRDEGIAVGAGDQRTFTFTVEREGKGGNFDLHGRRVVVHAGDREARRKLKRK